MKRSFFAAILVYLVAACFGEQGLDIGCSTGTCTSRPCCAGLRCEERRSVPARVCRAPPTPPVVGAITLSPAADSVEVGRGLIMTLTVTDTAGRTVSVAVSWAVLSLDVLGIIHHPSLVPALATPVTVTVWGKQTGTTTVTAFAGGQSASATVRVFGELQAFTQVSVGDGDTCGITAIGSAYCWGWNGIPIRVSYAVDFASIAPSGAYVCGLSVDGTAYCWGSNWFGRLGTGDLESRVEPAPVVGGLSFAAIGSGKSHACGLVPDGGAYCWGVNHQGQLGNDLGSSCDLFGNVAPCSPSPTLVSGGMQFVSLTVGGSHACGLTAAGTAHCWGANSYGQLGATTSETCDVYGTVLPCSRTPVAVSGGHTFTQLSAGGPYTCGITQTGSGYCWGWNVTGQLGTGDTISHAAPAPVAGDLAFRSLHANAHTLYTSGHTCGLTVDGDAYCWGGNESGQLGDSTTTTSLVPVLVLGQRFVSLSVGRGLTCGIAESGGGYCWGAGWRMSDTPKRVFGQP